MRFSLNRVLLHLIWNGSFSGGGNPASLYVMQVTGELKTDQGLEILAGGSLPDVASALFLSSSTDTAHL